MGPEKRLYQMSCIEQGDSAVVGVEEGTVELPSIDIHIHPDRGCISGDIDATNGRRDARGAFCKICGEKFNVHDAKIDRIRTRIKDKEHNRLRYPWSDAAAYC